MTSKLLIAAVALLSAFALYAQKPVVAAVTDIEDDPSNGLEMCRSLFNEYYLSELTTHSKVTMLDTASIQKEITKLQIPRGSAMNQKQISGLCSALKADALCLVRMKRTDKNAISITVSMVAGDGKKLGSVNAVMEGIGDTDAVSSKLAIESARLLRTLRGIAGEEPQEPAQEQAMPSKVTEI